MPTLVQYRKLLLITLVSLSCNHYTVEPIKIVFEINKRLVIDENCNLVVFSWNKQDYFSPVVIKNAFSERFSLRQLMPNTSKNLFPTSISCDCRYISMVSDTANGKFEMVLYDTSSKQLIRPMQDDGTDNGNGSFSPNASLLAFLSDGVLRLYDYSSREYRKIRKSVPDDFVQLVWQPLGEKIFLQGSYGDIYEYTLANDSYSLLWETPKLFIGNRYLSPVIKGEGFFFISDHLSDFNQIYRYQRGIVTPYVQSNNDKYLLGRTVGFEPLIYRENINGEYKVRGSQLVGQLLPPPKGGMVYDYFEGKNYNIYLKASLNSPVSIYRQNKTGEIENMLRADTIDNIKQPEVVSHKKGIIHYIYRPQKGNGSYVVWLHGGPHEQLTARYNLYLNNLVAMGFGVIVLNYPGSTGAGNSYELRDVSPDQWLSIQLRETKVELGKILDQRPEISDISLVGNSYGALIAQVLIRDSTFSFSKLIDFSGIYKYPVVPNTKPTLYIYGENDFMLNDPDRAGFIELESKRTNVNRIVLKGDGHTINRRSNNEIALNAMINFLNGASDFH